MTENWLIVTVISAWLIVQLARILAGYRTAKRRDEIKAARNAS